MTFIIEGSDPSTLLGIDGIDQWDSLVSDGPSVRDEVLVNIDEIQGNAAIIRGDYKYIVGKNNYNDWYGESGRSDRSHEEGQSPEYKAEDIISSQTGVALSSVSKKLKQPSLNSEDVYKLRSEAEVKCNVKREEMVRVNKKIKIVDYISIFLGFLQYNYICVPVQSEE